MGSASIQPTAEATVMEVWLYYVCNFLQYKGLEYHWIWVSGSSSGELAVVGWSQNQFPIDT